MASLKVGDLVTRHSYGSDLLFKIIKIKNQEAILKGIDVRLLADAPLKDLQKPTAKQLQALNHRFCLREQLNHLHRQKIGQQRGTNRSGRKGNNFFEVPPKILHLDGDEEYLKNCLQGYAAFSLNVEGQYIQEKKLPQVVSRLLKKYSPDLLVLTGHDAYLKRKGRDFSDLNNYRNSRYFVEATRAARRYEPSRDELIIFAGACQSHYEALLEAGANFASSPQRVFIHALDPVFVVKVVANTPIHAIANVSEAIASTFSGFDGIGGVESRGKLRLGLPKSPY